MSDISTTTNGSPPWQFSLRSLLVVFTIVCVLLAPYHWLGFTYLFSLALSLTLIVCSIRSYVQKWQMTPIFLSAFGVFSSFCIGIGSIVFLFHSICNLIGSIYADFTKPTARHFAIILASLTVVPYSILIGSGVKEFYRIGELRNQYPIESLTTRLQLEKSGDQIIQDESIQLDAVVDHRLFEFEQRIDTYGTYRATALIRLHNDTYRRFAAAEGFGPARMGMIPITGRFVDFVSYTRDSAVLPLSLKSQANTSATVITDSVHIKVLEDFFEPDSFGDVTNSSHVIGFEPHGPNHLNYSIGVMDDDDTSHWQLTRLELVSLLRHDEPRVYIADTIPLMNELQSLPHRALNEFEAAALPKLATSKDTVIEEIAGGAKMLGAIRAGNDCLQCHHGPRGKLLGAFSYEFRNVGE